MPTGADSAARVAKLEAAGVTASFLAGTVESSPVALQSATEWVRPADGVKWVLGSNLTTGRWSGVPELEGTYILSSSYPWEDTSNKQVKKMNKVIGNEVGNKDGFAEYGYQLGYLLEQSLNKIKGEVTGEAVEALGIEALPEVPARPGALHRRLHRRPVEPLRGDDPRRQEGRIRAQERLSRDSGEAVRPQAVATDQPGEVHHDVVGV